jgi:hypothetical protein
MSELFPFSFRSQNLRATTASAEGPEKLWVGLLGNLLEFPIRSNNFELDNVVNLHTELVCKRIVTTCLHPATKDAYTLRLLETRNEKSLTAYTMLSSKSHQTTLVGLGEEQFVVHASCNPSIMLFSWRGLDDVESRHVLGGWWELKASLHCPLPWLGDVELVRGIDRNCSLSQSLTIGFHVLLNQLFATHTVPLLKKVPPFLTLSDAATNELLGQIGNLTGNHIVHRSTS